MRPIGDKHDDEDKNKDDAGDDDESDDEIGVENSATTLVLSVGVSSRRRKPEFISLASLRASRNTKPQGSLQLG